jgi:hypothetical protein
MKYKYAKRSRISEAKTREVVRYFATDLTALQVAELSGLNRNTVNRFYRTLQLSVRGKRSITAYRRSRDGAAPVSPRLPIPGPALSDMTKFSRSVFEQRFGTGNLNVVMRETDVPHLRWREHAKRSPNIPAVAHLDCYRETTGTQSEEKRNFKRAAGLVDVRQRHIGTSRALHFGRFDTCRQVRRM